MIVLTFVNKEVHKEMAKPLLKQLRLCWRTATGCTQQSRGRASSQGQREYRLPKPFCLIFLIYFLKSSLFVNSA